MRNKSDVWVTYRFSNSQIRADFLQRQGVPIPDPEPFSEYSLFAKSQTPQNLVKLTLDTGAEDYPHPQFLA